MKEGVSRLKTVCYVTGVAGWLGSQVARDLLDRGYAVRGLVLPGDKSAQKLPEAVDQVEGDVTRPEDIARFLEAGEERDRIVIHCAAIITMSIGPVSSVHQVNVEGTRHMIEACAPLHVRRFIYVSSVHAIPERPRKNRHRGARFDPARVARRLRQEKQGGATSWCWTLRSAPPACRRAPSLRHLRPRGQRHRKPQPDVHRLL